MEDFLLLTGVWMGWVNYGKYSGKFHCLNYDLGAQGESNWNNTNKVANKFVHVGNVNDEVVIIQGNSIIQFVFAS